MPSTPMANAYVPSGGVADPEQPVEGGRPVVADRPDRGAVPTGSSVLPCVARRSSVWDMAVVRPANAGAASAPIRRRHSVELSPTDGAMAANVTARRPERRRPPV